MANPAEQEINTLEVLRDFIFKANAFIKTAEEGENEENLRNQRKKKLKAFLELVDEWHAIFQANRSLMRFATLGNAFGLGSEDHAHPVEDWLNDLLNGFLDLNLDEDGESSAIVFIVLAATYGMYYLSVLGFINGCKLKNLTKEQIAELLPDRIEYALFEAKIWGSYNIGTAVTEAILVALHADEEGNLAYGDMLQGLSLGLWSGLMVADAWNSMREHKANIIKYTKELVGLEQEKTKLDPNNDDDQLAEYFKVTNKIRKLETNLQMSKDKWGCALGFGIIAVSAGVCISTAGALNFSAKCLAKTDPDNPMIAQLSEAASHLAFSGGMLLFSASLLFAAVRWGIEERAYAKEDKKIIAEIEKINRGYNDPSNGQRMSDKRSIALTQQKTALVHRQEEIKFEKLKSRVYYTALVCVITVSFFSGGVAGLIAMPAFFLICMAIKLTPAESYIKARFLDRSRAKESAAPLPTRVGNPYVISVC